MKTNSEATNKPVNYKLFAFILAVFLAIGLFFVARQYLEIRSLKKQVNTDTDQLIAEKELFIKQKQIEITKLKIDNKRKDVAIENANKKIDSLENVESKIRVVYIDRIKQIKGFNATELENYWENEFK